MSWGLKPGQARPLAATSNLGGIKRPLAATGNLVFGGGRRDH